MPGDVTVTSHLVRRSAIVAAVMDKNSPEAGRAGRLAAPKPWRRRERGRLARVFPARRATGHSPLAAVPAASSRRPVVRGPLEP
jgi:hypothetical protein